MTSVHAGTLAAIALASTSWMVAGEIDFNCGE